MKQLQKYQLWIFAFLLSDLILVSGFIFHRAIVGPDNTNLMSVIFGWQWIYLAIISLAVFVIALIKIISR